MNHVSSDKIRLLSDAEAGEVVYAPYETRTQLINDSPRAIRVATRAGLKFILEPRFNPKTSIQELKARTTIGISADVQYQLLGMFSRAETGERRAVIQEAMKIWANWTRMRPRPLQAEYVISQDLMISSGGALYVKELDYAFTFDLQDETFCHPYSVEAGLRNIAEIYTDNPDDQYVLSITIVDNAEKIGPRWIKDAFGVSRIEPVKSDKSDGFYIVRTSSATTGLQKGTITTEYHESETTLVGMRLYTSWAQAFNSDSANQAEIAANELRAKLQQSQNMLERTQLDHETTVAAAQQQRDKLQYEKERLQHDKEVLIQEAKNAKEKFKRERAKLESDKEKAERDYKYARAQHEEAMERLRAEREKTREADRIDAATHTRRTVLDILKLVASLVSGFFSVLLFARKLKPA